MIQIWNGDIVLPDKVLKNGQIIVENGKIKYLGDKQEIYAPNVDIIKWEDGQIWPGLIDIHIHGIGGADVMELNNDSIFRMTQVLLKFGVTGFLATTMASSMEHLSDVLSKIALYNQEKNQAELLGIHLEGPWINPKYKDAQNERFIRTPKKGEGISFFNKAQGKLKIVTIAPEIINGFEMIQELNQLGVVISIGHSDASYKDVERSIELGATNITHTFNGMRGFHHRDTGMVGSALLNGNLFCELIADGDHVDPVAVKILFKSKGSDKIILVSDGIKAIGMPDGEYNLGGLKVVAKEGKASLEDGTLAGSLLTLNKAIMNMVEFVGIPIWEAVKMASLNPAKVLGLDSEIGSIELGKRANLVGVDRNGEVQQIWIDGTKQL